MINLHIYLFQVSIALGLFIIFYRLLLIQLTFFTWNRCYLITTAILSLLIPLNNFALFPNTDILSNPIIASTPDLEIWVVKKTIPLLTSQQKTFSPWLLFISCLSFGYAVVASHRLYKLILDVYSLIQLIRRYPRYGCGNSWIVCIEEQVPASSFFGYILLSSKELKSPYIATILTHEQVHCQQGHSFDRLFMELLSALFWFHPMMKWWKRALTENHEFLADTAAASKGDPTTYASLLLQLASPNNDTLPLVKFSYGQLKSRIIMLHQSRSNKLLLLRFLLAWPLAMGLLLVYSCEKAPDIHPQTQLSPQKHEKGSSRLIGKWIATNVVIINEDDSQQHRSLSAGANSPASCFSELSFFADGSFYMQDTQTGSSHSGSRRSDEFGISLNLTYYDPSSKENRSGQEIFLRDGSPYMGLLPSVINLSVTGLHRDRMEAWQYYPADEKYSAASIYYEYNRE